MDHKLSTPLTPTVVKAARKIKYHLITYAKVK